MMRSTGMHGHPKDIEAQRHVEGCSPVVIGFDLGTPMPSRVMIIDGGKLVRFVDERTYFEAEKRRQDLIIARADSSEPWRALKRIFFGGARHGR